DAVRVDQEGGVAGEFGEGRDVGGDDGDAGGHRLRDRKAEAFIERRVGEDRRGGGERGEVGLGDIAQVADHVEAGDRRFGSPADRTRDDEVVGAAKVSGKRCEGVEEEVDVLARLDGAEREDEGAVELVAGADGFDGGGGWVEEGGGDAGVDGGDFLRGDV